LDETVLGSVSVLVYLLYDVDGDGYITLADASNLQRILIGLDPIL
jgi:hypothetical protein